MPTTVTLKECKRKVSQLPRKQRTALAKNILQEDYEQECFKKAAECFHEIETGKIEEFPLDEALRDIRKSLKRMSSR